MKWFLIGHQDNMADENATEEYKQQRGSPHWLLLPIKEYVLATDADRYPVGDTASLHPAKGQASNTGSIHDPVIQVEEGSGFHGRPDSDAEISHLDHAVWAEKG